MSSSFRYPEYYCSRNAPLKCDQPQSTIEQHKGAKFCLECGFPAPLMPQQQIQGRRGTYQVKKLLGARGGGRLYAGTQIGSGQFVLIKEYLLPNRCFSPEVARQRKEIFSRIAGLTPADGRVQDFRVLATLEAIADPQSDRALLITPQKEAFPTLSQHLSQHGAMSASQVREVLGQVLQTLQFLHSQRFRRPSGQMDQGIVHGNISLDSLLLAGNPSHHIYLCDLAEWEFLFLPNSSAAKPQVSDDLTALGYVGFYLLNGTSTNPSTGQALDPRDNQSWSKTDPALKRFLLQLIGLEAPFESAEAARYELLQLPQQEPQNQGRGLSIPQHSSKGISKYWWFPVGAIALVLLAGGLFYLLNPPSHTSAKQFEDYKRIPAKSFADVPGIEPGKNIYVSQKEGTWTDVLGRQPDAASLNDVLTRPVANIDATFTHNPLDLQPSLQENENTFAAIAAVKQQTDFAITSLSDPELDQTHIAYDGLLVIVPFSRKERNLPQALQGRIRLDDLRRLFTGEIKNWKELSNIDLPVVLQVPTELEALHQFRKRVLKDDPQAIAKFQQIVNQQKTEDTQRQMVNAFDAGEAGIISFGILSKTWKQCNGYPLAIVTQNGTVAQPLMRTQTDQSITPNDNLCDKNVRLDVELFRSDRYPLGYPLRVVYPKDNRKTTGRQFATLLKETQQGQCLLSKVGLVPLQPVPDLCP